MGEVEAVESQQLNLSPIFSHTQRRKGRAPPRSSPGPLWPFYGCFLPSLWTLLPFRPCSGRALCHLTRLLLGLQTASAPCGPAHPMLCCEHPHCAHFLLMGSLTRRAGGLSREPSPSECSHLGVSGVLFHLSSANTTVMAPSPLWLFPPRPARLSSAFCPGYTLWSDAWKLLLPSFPPTGRTRPCAWNAWSCGRGALGREAAAA